MIRNISRFCLSALLLVILTTGSIAVAEETVFTFEVNALAGDSLQSGIGPQANPIIQAASVSLTSGEKIYFSLTANKPVNISVTSCTLQVKENGSWKSAGSVPLPSSASSIETYDKTVDVSSLISTGKTYKVTCTFQAGTESVSRSHERTY